MTEEPKEEVKITVHDALEMLYELEDAFKKAIDKLKDSLRELRRKHAER